MNGFVKYLWRRGWRTRLQTFGLYGASLGFVYSGFIDLGIFLIGAMMVFTLLEVQQVYAKLFWNILEENDLDLSEYEDKTENEFFEELN